MYNDIQIVGQFEMLKKSCDVRGFSISVEMVYSYDAESKPVSCSENIVVRRKNDNQIAFIAVSFIHAQGFLDGIDYCSHKESKQK